MGGRLYGGAHREKDGWCGFRGTAAAAGQFGVTETATDQRIRKALRPDRDQNDSLAQIAHGTQSVPLSIFHFGSLMVEANAGSLDSCRSHYRPFLSGTFHVPTYIEKRALAFTENICNYLSLGNLF